MKKFVVISCVALFAAACEKVIEPGELPEQDTRLVINTVLDPDSVISVNLSQSKSIISGKDYKTVDKEKVFVYEDDVLFEQLSFVAKGKYIGTKKPAIGKSYKVIARATSLQDAEGTTKVPPIPLVAAAERIDSANTTLSYYDDAPSKSTSIYGTINYKISLNDVSGSNDYYSLDLSFTAVDSSGTETATFPGSYLHSLTEGQNGDQNSFFYRGLYGSDQEGVENGKRVFRFGCEIYGGGMSVHLARPITIYPVLLVKQYSEEYYKYLQTASKQISTGASFFAEPTVIYSNCSNGMGVVGARNAKYVMLPPIILK